jgi:hypothetical protein
MPVTNGSGSGFGSGSCYFCLDIQDTNKNPVKKQKFLRLLLFEGTYTSFFKVKKVERSHKTVGIKAFLTIFA